MDCYFSYPFIQYLLSLFVFHDLYLLLNDISIEILTMNALQLLSFNSYSISLIYIYSSINLYLISLII